MRAAIVALLFAASAAPAAAAVFDLERLQESKAGSAVFGWLEKNDLKLASRMGVPLIHRFDSNEQLTGAKFTIWNPRGAEWFDVSHYHLKRVNAETVNGPDDQGRPNVLAMIALDEVVKKYLVKWPEKWTLNKIDVGAVGGYDLALGEWWWGIQGNLEFDLPWSAAKEKK